MLPKAWRRGVFIGVVVVLALLVLWSVLERRDDSGDGLSGTMPGGTTTGGFFYDYVPDDSASSTVRAGETFVMDRGLQPGRGDVVLVVPQGGLDPGFSGSAVHRVFAVSSDTVECPPAADGRCSTMLVNGVALPTAEGCCEPIPATTIPVGKVFVARLWDANSPVSWQPEIVTDEEITGVAVQIVGVDGKPRPVPNAPVHTSPGPNQRIDGERHPETTPTNTPDTAR